MILTNVWSSIVFLCLYPAGQKELSLFLPILFQLQLQFFLIFLIKKNWKNLLHKTTGSFQTKFTCYRVWLPPHVTAPPKMACHLWRRSSDSDSTERWRGDGTAMATAQIKMALKMANFTYLLAAAIIRKSLWKKILFCVNITGIKDYSDKFSFCPTASL